MLIQILLLFLQSVLFASLVSSSLIDPDRVVGQTFLNFLRDSVAVSGLPSTFGRFSHAVISRVVTSPSNVPTAIDQYTLSILKQPTKLSSLVADVGTDLRQNTVTITASFACVDRGNSNADSIQWWVSEGSIFGPLTELNNSVGGAESQRKSTAGSDTDIIDKCLSKQVDQTSEGFRFVEHDGIHAGDGDYFKTFGPNNTPTEPIIPTIEMINRILKIRRESENDFKEVIYDEETKIPVVLGLPFTTGCRVKVPENIKDDIKTNEVRVTATQIMALRATLGAQLQEANVDVGESRTAPQIVVLSVLSTGLGLVIASWLIYKFIADTAAVKFENLKMKGIKAVVNGSNLTRGVDTAHKMLIFIECLAGLILLTPLAESIVSGQADPRASVEVSSGVSIFYGSSYRSMSDDWNNPIAGAPFVVSVWVKVRQLDNGFYLPFFLSLGGIAIVSILVSLNELRRLSCTMPSHASELAGFSFWKSFGALRLKYKLKFMSDPRTAVYKVYVEFKDDVRFDNQFKAKVLLLGAVGFRQMAREYVPRRSRREYDINRTREDDAELLVEHLKTVRPLSEDNQTFSLIGTVRMTKTTRFESMMTQSKMHHNYLPRCWYYLLNEDGEDGTQTIEYYRTMGCYPKDQYLVIARLGLLDYLEDIKYIEVQSEGEHVKGKNLDTDGIKVSVLQARSLDPRSKCYVSVDDDSGVKMKILRDGEAPCQAMKEFDPTMSSGDLLIDKVDRNFNTREEGRIQILSELE